RLNHVFASCLTGLKHLLRNIAVNEGHALIGFIPDDRLHLDQIDDTFEILFSTNGELHWYRSYTKTFAQLVHYAHKVGARTVHLIDEHDARYCIFVGLTPDGFSLRLNT